MARWSGSWIGPGGTPPCSPCCSSGARPGGEATAASDVDVCLVLAPGTDPTRVRLDHLSRFDLDVHAFQALPLYRAAEMAERLREMTGLRNILDHGYAPVDDRIVFETLRSGLGDLERFMEQVARFPRERAPA